MRQTGSSDSELNHNMSLFNTFRPPFATKVKQTVVILTMLAPVASYSEPEAWYVTKYCDGGIEVVLSDRTRVDCLTASHAIEYDFGRKWSEAIGQSLGYAFETNKRAGVVLILERKADYKYWIKMNSIIDHYHLPISSWKIEAFNDRESGQ